jgi:hypothetical protein
LGKNDSDFEGFHRHSKALPKRYYHSVTPRQAQKSKATLVAQGGFE